MDLNEVIRAVELHGPQRVVIRDDGYSVSSGRAREENYVVPDVVFVRGDGWTLGAPASLRDVAQTMWSDDWVAELVLDDRGRVISVIV